MEELVTAALVIGVPVLVIWTVARIIDPARRVEALPISIEGSMLTIHLRNKTRRNLAIEMLGFALRVKDGDYMLVKLPEKPRFLAPRAELQEDYPITGIEEKIREFIRSDTQMIGIRFNAKGRMNFAEDKFQTLRTSLKVTAQQTGDGNEGHARPRQDP